MKTGFPDGEYLDRLPLLLQSACLAVMIANDGRYTLSPHAEVRVEERKADMPKKLPFNQATFIRAVVKDGELDKFLVAFPLRDGDAMYVMYTVNAYVLTLYFGPPPAINFPENVTGPCRLWPHRRTIPNNYDPANNHYKDLTDSLVAQGISLTGANGLPKRAGRPSVKRG